MRGTGTLCRADGDGKGTAAVETTLAAPQKLNYKNYHLTQQFHS